MVDNFVDLLMAGAYDDAQMHDIKSFVAHAQSRLDEAGVRPGRQPGSDVGLGKFASYRNEQFDRAASVDQMAAMSQEPMAQLLKD